MRAATLCVFLERNTARSRAWYAVLPKLAGGGGRGGASRGPTPGHDCYDVGRCVVLSVMIADDGYCLDDVCPSSALRKFRDELINQTFRLGGIVMHAEGFLKPCVFTSGFQKSPF